MDIEQQSLVLTVLDTSGIQPYIFGANNLKQSVGASELVRWATEDAARETLIEVFGRDAVNVDEKGRVPERYLAYPPEGKTVTSGLKAEWINAGGGNTLLLFRNLGLAKEFTKALTLKLYDAAPGVNLIVVHEKVREGSALTTVVDAAIKKANRKKQNRLRSTPMLGLGVTASCQFTGLPATTEYEDDEDGSGDLRRISAEVAYKRGKAGKAQQRLQDLLAQELGDQYTLLLNFDQLGIKGEASYMGVVHVDGNGMGKRVQRIAADHSTPEQNRGYIEAIRAFSESIKDASEVALRHTVRALIGRIESDEDEYVKLRREDGKTILPFRPIVYGGDDTTFVCDGRFALSLAQYFMAALEGQALDDKDNLYVRAGVAVVKSHYPFARAYELAEDLAKSAKKLINECKSAVAPDAPYARFSAMDWHFATTGLVLDLPQIRRREYTRQTDGDLAMRPLLIHEYDVAEKWRRWETFSALVEQFNSRLWAGKRNKIKTLREVLRQGSEGTALFIDALGEDHCLDAIDGNVGSAKSGWYYDRCAWADAIEALDLFVPLARQASTEDQNGTGGDV